MYDCLCKLIFRDWVAGIWCSGYVMSKSSYHGDGRYWVRISVPAPTQSGVLKAQWVGVRPLHPLLSH